MEVILRWLVGLDPEGRQADGRISEQQQVGRARRLDFRRRLQQAHKRTQVGALRASNLRGSLRHCAGDRLIRLVSPRRFLSIGVRLRSSRLSGRLFAADQVNSVVQGNNQQLSRAQVLSRCLVLRAG